MALLRVSGFHNIAAQPQREEELILNTAHIMLAYPDIQSPSRGTLVQLVHGDQILIAMKFDEFWTLVQRET
ncbi:MAG: hypothetical protein FJ404_04045 [Verrucomicrobia bacterium]|nr:hypothetical protein [Verrucomicrobiota bacterium]